MKWMKVAVFAVAAVMWAACSGDPVRHTPDASALPDAAIDAAPDAPPQAVAMLAASPGDTDFGSVVLGQTTSTVTYTISNSGDSLSGELDVSLDPASGAFAVSDNTCDGHKLGKYDTCTFALAFTPATAGVATATVHISASPGGEVTRNVTGTGLTPGALDIVQASHAFNPRAIDGTPTTATFTVKNTGQVATGTPTPSITGTANAYAVASTTCNGPLAPSATCNVVVKFAPKTVGSKPGSLVVTGTPGGSDSATLSGTGVAHVAVTKIGNGGGTVTSNTTGIDCGSACTADFSSTPVTLTATADTGVDFTGWTGDCSNMTPCTLDLTASKNIGATFTKKRFALTTSATGNGSGTITGGGTYDYSTTPITVTATPDASSTFTGWGGDCAGMPTCTVTMTANHNVTANFTLKQFALTTATTGNGTVSLDPSGGTYDYNTPVTITATPATGWQFASWGGDCAGTTTATCTVSMTANRNVTATFTKQRFTLTTSITGSGTLNPSGGTYDYQTPVTITATPATGWQFASWGGDCAGTTTATCTVSMTTNHTVSATFTAIPETLSVTTSSGGTIVSTPAGISCTVGTCTHDFAYGTPVKLEAVLQPGMVVAAVGGACSALPCTVTMDQARSVTVEIVRQQFKFTLGESSDPPSLPMNVAVTTPTGTTNYQNAPSSTFSVYYGDSVTLTASTTSDFWFGGWTGACSSFGRNKTCSLTVTGDTSTTATFVEVSYSFGLVATTQSPNGIYFDVTYPLGSTRPDCQSAPSPGTTCTGNGYTYQVQTLTAHLPSIAGAVVSWNTLPTWTGCDSVSADRLTCTFTVTGSRHVVTVSGDAKIGP